MVILVEVQITSLWAGLIAPPIIVTLLEPVVDVQCFFTGLGAVIPRMSDLTIDFASHLQIRGQNGGLHCFLLVGPFVQS